MKNLFDPLHHLNGRFKWAIFIAVILSAAFTYVFWVKKDEAIRPEDLKTVIENQQFMMQNQKEVFRGWKKSQPGVPIDTTELFKEYEQRKKVTDSILEKREEK